MTSDQDAKVVAEPQTQRVQEGKDSAHLMNGPISQTTSQTSSIPPLSQKTLLSYRCQRTVLFGDGMIETDSSYQQLRFQS
ncbi:LARP4B isoform 3 [Pan troglodytes]|uniref:La ribonucleoprotein 4B n=2 Tax=Homininae TaxID=207598 RepID=V9GYI5_HUMAN|nr:La ribonucleoprotein 4B [Homo sapiens]KAI4075034.1 La ribonucleoprotein 4B [Homo sapiens]PNI17461.1 LARP4B isoform 3 [Pan troglodytes]